MLNPDLRGVLKDHLSRYSLVIAAARRAREITDEHEHRDKTRGDPALEEKPLSVAIEEILKGEFVIAEPEEIRHL
ncbi:MAG: DNA-directed RNA polymerase subunit omega [Oscillospiraceae bacterium]|jgi:DNA-directed RNA polymerase subunit omega|nr:DNA-directed RNA polymerase subunit omega [Oscillospiraceae bacterium]